MGGVFFCFLQIRPNITNSQRTPQNATSGVPGTSPMKTPDSDVHMSSRRAVDICRDRCPFRSGLLNTDTCSTGFSLGAIIYQCACICPQQTGQCASHRAHLLEASFFLGTSNSWYSNILESAKALVDLQLSGHPRLTVPWTLLGQLST